MLDKCDIMPPGPYGLSTLDPYSRRLVSHFSTESMDRRSRWASLRRRSWACVCVWVCVCGGVCVGVCGCVLVSVLVIIFHILLDEF